MNVKQAIVFYFPHHKIGGVSILFLRMAESLASRFSVYVADYSDGYMANNLSKNIKLLRIDRGDHFPGGSIFIFQSFLPWRFPFLAKVDPQSKVFFWNLHPNNFDPSIFNEKTKYYPFRLIAKFFNLLGWKRKYKTKKIVKYLLDNKALAFMDIENLRSTEDFVGGKLYVDDYLPVATPKLVRKHFFELASDEIKIGWVGRLADFKYRILEHLMKRLSHLDIENKTIILIVIGDGEYQDYLKREALLVTSHKFKIIFLGELPPSDLHKYITENIDIVFSMGASALEAASIGLPVFLTDYSYDMVKNNYKFSLLYEKHGYCLGEKITVESYERECTLKNSILSVIENYEHYSNMCFKYWEKNFSLDCVANSLSGKLHLTTATFGEMKKNEYFEPDNLGLFMRSLGWRLRMRSSKDVEGFRHDC